VFVCLFVCSFVYVNTVASSIVKLYEWLYNASQIMPNGLRPHCAKFTQLKM